MDAADASRWTPAHDVPARRSVGVDRAEAPAATAYRQITQLNMRTARESGEAPFEQGNKDLTTPAKCCSGISFDREASRRLKRPGTSRFQRRA